MPTFKKKELTELVGGDMNSNGGDRNVTNDSEIETGPVQKPHDDNSDYEKGQSPTTDRVVARYRQDIPWFAVYSYGGTRSGASLNTSEGVEKKNIIKKKQVEEKIEDLVKKSYNSDITDKNYNPKVAKIIDTIFDADLSQDQLNDLEKAIKDRKNKQKTAKTI